MSFPQRYHPPQHIYKQHPWRRCGKETWTGFVLAGLYMREHGFYTRDFITAMRDHHAASGRKPPRENSMRGRFSYYWTQGYLIRRPAWVEESPLGWFEWCDTRRTSIPVQWEAPAGYTVDPIPPLGRPPSASRNDGYQPAWDEPSPEQQTQALIDLAEWDRKKAAESAEKAAEEYRQGGDK